VIYAIRAVGTEFIKFGYTKDKSPKQRVASLQVGCPFRLEVEAFMPGSEQEERAIHGFLSDASVRGEWFRTTPMVLAILDEMKKRQPRLWFFDVLSVVLRTRSPEAASVMVEAFARDKLPTPEHQFLWDMCQRMVEKANGRQKGDEASAS
jgi:hypothetical protein